MSEQAVSEQAVSERAGLERRLALLARLSEAERALEAAVAGALAPPARGWLSRLLSPSRTGAPPGDARQQILPPLRALGHQLELLDGELRLMEASGEAPEEQATLRRLRAAMSALHAAGEAALAAAAPSGWERAAAADAARRVSALSTEGSAFLREDACALEEELARLDREAALRRDAAAEVARALEEER